jgi:cation diffusion facilitator CzcD-associated flavoprotein CzcO
MQHLQHYKCVIVGSGFSGICLAIRLKQSGIDDFIVLEKAHEIGGTWRDNHYPGAECDVPSALYSFSFETKTDWDYQWSEQRQILEYIHNTARIHGITPHVRLGRELVAAKYDTVNARWHLLLANREQLTAQFLVSAVGQLHKPNIPTFDGAETFRGPAFHSANWQHAINLKGKSVCVIGNAASATQFIPSVAQQAARLTVFQRSASWVSQKRDKPYTERQKKWMRRFPFTKRLERLSIYLRNELIAYPALKGRWLNKWLLKMACQDYLNSVVTDATLRQKLTPDYPVGAKRILIVEGYYEALVRDNVELVTEAIEAIDETGIRTHDGKHYPCDVIIYGTGFITNPFLDGIHLRGKSGALLAEHWASGAQAYLGITTSDFPNLFFMYGPNTNLGHNSILLMAESQANYILQALQSTEQSGAAVLEVRTDIETEYNRTLQKRLHRMVWDSVASSWYKSGGRITNNWPGSVGEYKRVTRNFRASDYAMSQAGYAAETDIASHASSQR